MSRSDLRTAIAACLFTLQATSCQSAEAPAPPVVAGYLPSYRLKGLDLQRLQGVTDVILFSIEPTDSGGLHAARLPGTAIDPLRRELQARGCRVLVTIGGWGHSTAFPKVCREERLRKALVKSLAAFCEKHELDGVDVDWEHPADEAQRRDLGRLLRELKRELAPQQRLVTIALAPWDRLPPDSIDALDRIHLMAYDNGGRHSTLEYASTSIDRMTQQGVPAGKICLGIPFYGRPYVGKFGSARTYAEIVSRHKPPANADEASGFYFNGPATVAAKVRLAREKSLAGVMIWELGQDAAEADRSLLRVIDEARQE